LCGLKQKLDVVPQMIDAFSGNSQAVMWRAGGLAVVRLGFVEQRHGELRN